MPIPIDFKICQGLHQENTFVISRIGVDFRLRSKLGKKGGWRGWEKSFGVASAGIVDLAP